MAVRSHRTSAAVTCRAQYSDVLADRSRFSHSACRFRGARLISCSLRESRSGACFGPMVGVPAA